MHNDNIYYDTDTVISPKGYTTSRTHNGNKVLDPATCDLLRAWCVEHRPDLVWLCDVALASSSVYWSLRNGYGYGNRDDMRAAARMVRALMARPVNAFQTWSLSN